ncbi:hypothetical protein GGF32_001253 [Allomyces javanicus]|nr:hypothetical protein GGF32_001253 [Allomyces javanicus]
MTKAQMAIYQAKQPESKLVLVNIPISSIPADHAVSSVQFDFVQVWASMFKKHDFLRSPGSARISAARSVETAMAHDGLGRDRENVPPAAASADLSRARPDASDRARALDTDARNGTDTWRTDPRAIQPKVPSSSRGQDHDDYDTLKDGRRDDWRDQAHRGDLLNQDRHSNLPDRTCRAGLRDATRGEDSRGSSARRHDSRETLRGDSRDTTRRDASREQTLDDNAREETRRGDSRNQGRRDDSRTQARRDDSHDQIRRDDSHDRTRREDFRETWRDDSQHQTRRDDPRDRRATPTSSDCDRTQPARPAPRLNQDAAYLRALLTARRAESTAARRPSSRSRSPPPFRSDPRSQSRSRSRSPAWRGRHARSPSPPPRKRTEPRQYEGDRTARAPSPRDRRMRFPSLPPRPARAHETEERNYRSAPASRRSPSPPPHRARFEYAPTSDRIAAESLSRRTSTEPSTRRDSAGTSRCRSRSPPRHRRRDDRSRSPPPPPYGAPAARSTRISDSGSARITYSNRTTAAATDRRGNWTNSYTPSSRSLAGSTTPTGSSATSVTVFSSESPRPRDARDANSPAVPSDSTTSERDVQEPPRAKPEPPRVAPGWPRLAEISGADAASVPESVLDRARARSTSVIDLDDDADEAMDVVEPPRAQHARDATTKRAAPDVALAASTEPEPQRVASGWPRLNETASSSAAPAATRTHSRLLTATEPGDDSDNDIVVVERAPPAPTRDDRVSPAPVQHDRQVHGLLPLAEPTRSASNLTPLDPTRRATADVPAAPPAAPRVTPASQAAAATSAVTAAFSAYAQATAPPRVDPAATNTSTAWASRILSASATTTPGPATRVPLRAAPPSYASRSATTSPAPPGLASAAASSTLAWFGASAAPAHPPAPAHLPAYGSIAHSPAYGTPAPPPYAAPAAAARVASATPPPTAAAAAAAPIQLTNHVPLKIYPASIFAGNQGQFKSKLEEYVKIPEHHGLLSKPEYTIVEAAGGQAGPFGCRLVLAAPEARYVFEVPTVHSKKKSAEQAVAEIAMRALNLIGGTPRAPPAAAVGPAAVPPTVMHVPARTPSPAAPAALAATPPLAQMLYPPPVANVQYTLAEIGRNFVGKLNEHAQKCGWAAPTYLEDRERADGGRPKRHRMKLRVNGTSYEGPWVELQSTTMRAKQAAAKMVMQELDLIRGGGR